jgi:SET and MYND domain-containing protein
MAAILPAQPTGTIRLALRLMMKKKAHLGKKSKDSFWPVDLLYEYGKHLPTSTKKADYPEFDLIQLMCKRNKHIHVCDKHEVFSLLDRLVHNAFYLLNMDLAMNINGEGLYILPSFLNHSCQPNCTVLFDGLRMSVRSLQDIEPGQQLYITYYSDLHAHPNERQESLKNRYHFNCQCRRCSLVRVYNIHAESGISK